MFPIVTVLELSAHVPGAVGASGSVLLEDICYWGRALRAHSLIPPPDCSFCFMLVVVNMVALLPALATCCHVYPPLRTLLLEPQTKINSFFFMSRFQSCPFVTATEMQPVPFPEGFQKMCPSASGHYLKQDKEAQRCCSGGWGTQRPESGVVPFVTFPVCWDTLILPQTLKKAGI